MAEINAYLEPEQLTMFGIDIAPEQGKETSKSQPRGRKVKEPKVAELVDIDSLTISVSQPRHYVNEEQLEELCATIKKHGVLQPVLVQTEPDGSYVLIAGQRRLLAARKAGLKKIPVVIVDGDPFEIALIENLQRSELTSLEEAEALSRLKEINGYTLEEISSIMGKSKSTISETLSLSRLPEEVKERCRCDSSVAKTILVEIARLPNPEAMMQAFEKYRQDKLPREQLRKDKHPENPKNRVSSAFLKGWSKKIGILEVEGLKKKQREQMRSRLSDLHAKIGELLVKLEN